jgi:hypothetical protein
VEEEAHDREFDRSILLEVTSLIRYPLMDMEEFRSEVVPTGVLSESLVIGMFQFLSG